MPEVMKEDDEQQKDDEIVIVEDEKQLQSAEATGVDDENTAEDERTARSDDDEPDEEELRRQRRREERQARKEKRNELIARDKTELNFLRKRNDELERRLSAQEQRSFSNDLSQIDDQIAKAKNEAEMADRVIAKAVAAGNGDDVAQALRYRDEAMLRMQQLAYQKQLASQRQVQQPGIDEMTMQHVKEFVEENPWYDPKGNDEDSAIVLAIDQTLVREGYDSRSEEYWDELRRRASRRLPDRFAAEDAGDDRRAEPAPQRKPRGGPAVGSGREHAPASTRKEIYISPERKQALIDAGVWDDPVLRMRYVKRYAQYDRDQKSQA